MKLSMFKSKLHQMRVTEANLMYEGSITIDEDLLDMANILPYEKVSVVNITNGSRLETYTIPGERGSRVCCMNGAAARLTQVNDRIIVISFAEMEPEEAKQHKPTVVVVDENNNPQKILEQSVQGRSFDLESGLMEPSN
ncbi:aspartate 1-decarboxylase [Rhodohalobacter sp. 614A]|uniref:aspartate 1-decarboxylase n=1 Tax=Rhodohalobacter sp. 614A TaxID=2908649 RepID=UPI001F28AC1B|nr:aspartate 1-decarboxylase [Rhodohalobacter sp. 614A]